MIYRAAGRSGLLLSRLIVGSTMFGELMREDEAKAVLHRAWDLGAHSIDTGDIYAGSRSEEMIGRLIAGRRDRVVLCTKVGFRVGDKPEDHARAVMGTLDHAERWTRGIAPHDQGLSRHHIVSAVEDSLRRLGTDYIDLYQMHRWDPLVPVEETLRALEDLIRSGKVRYIGCSNARSWQLYESLWTSDVKGLPRFETMQAPYSMMAREPEADLFPACAHAGVGVIAYSTLAGGALSGAHDAGIKPNSVMAQRPAYQQRYLAPANLERLDRFGKLAQDLGKDQTGLALAAVLQHPAVIAATVGMQTPEEVDLLAAAASEPLDAATYDAIRAIFSAG
ncbi:Predicted oxidoreductase [Sphingobium faniae]|nr:Predicted oxidoreductase [Sphingobium faniae]